MGYDLLIRNGRVIDGTGNPWFRADVGVVGDRIVALGRLSDEAAVVLDAGDQVVCPGFVDMHTHSDLMVFVEPTLPPKLQQGVTMEVITQDGKSAAPVSRQTEPVWRRILAAVDGNPPIEWAWTDLGSYMQALEQAAPAMNLATMVPYGNVRSLVYGFDPGAPDAQQVEHMKELVALAMEQGAFGMSAGLIYQPQMYSTTEELTELCRVVGRYNGMLAVHMRNEGDLLLQATDEVIRICLESGCTLHISHLKVLGQRNWHKGPLLMEKLERARAMGLDLTFDQYPYTAASTALHAILPPWVTEGGVEKILQRLGNRKLRTRIAWEIEHLVGEQRPTEDPVMRFWENFAASAGWKSVRITSVGLAENKPMEGRSVADLAAERGMAPVDFVFDLLVQEACNVSMAAFISSEENVKRMLGHELGMLGSDGLLVGKPHPRAYGSFPRALGRYVREGVHTLPQMVRRMTSLPSRRLGLWDRGLVSPGMKADLVLFDPDTISDMATYDDPTQFPRGIAAVIVNGGVACQNGVITGARRGEILRRPGR